MNRGDLIVVVFAGDYGKPRPALVVQSEAFGFTQSITVVPLTSHLVPAPLIRIDVHPSEANGIKAPSQLMLDKMASVHRTKLGQRIGALDPETLADVDRALACFLGLA